jgi:predicted ATP-grasp superfamily ATP-dependent carboligase
VINELTIIGSSVRAAAQSALRTGYTVYAADLFADADLRRICRAVAVSDYPDGLARVVAGPQGGCWMYTGALENSPELVERLTGSRPLIGNSAEVLRAVRRPELVAAALGDAGLPSPQVRVHESPGEPGWLRKPICSAGGLHIRPCDESTPVFDSNSSGSYYYQQRIAGTPCSAAYLAARGKVQLLGVTRQLIGERWTGAVGFRYCGSVGPLAVTAEQFGELARIGAVLTERFALAGLFGVDAILNDDGLWTVEVNPRYTASMEVIERAIGQPLIDLHVHACQRGALAEVPNISHGPQPTFGKTIIFAEHSFTVDDDWTSLDESSFDWPQLADIPLPGARIEAGWPVVTVLTTGRDEHEVMTSLRHRVAEMQRRIAAQTRPAALRG